MLDLIKHHLPAHCQTDSWIQEIDAWGEENALLRDYFESDQRVYLTDEQLDILNLDRSRLNVSGKGGSRGGRKGGTYEVFNANYCEPVVRTMADRMVVNDIMALTAGDQNEAGQEWVDALLERNRFDALQADIHEALLRDGDTFVIVEYDEEMAGAKLSLNLSYDQEYGGMVPLYNSLTGRDMIGAVKVICDDEHSGSMYGYGGAAVQKWTVRPTGNEESPMSLSQDSAYPQKWASPKLPVIHFSNRRLSRSFHGQSEMRPMLSLQDAVNRVIASLVIAGELTAYQIYFSNFAFDTQIGPGVAIMAEEAIKEKMAQLKLEAIPGGQLDQVVLLVDTLRDVIAEITQTPLPSVMGANPSGEALKQRESGLESKLRKCTVKVGNAYEDMLLAAHAIESTYAPAGRKPPPIDMFSCNWRDTQTRDKMLTIDNAMKVHGVLNDSSVFVKMVAPALEWSDAYQQQIMDDAEARKAEMQQMMMNGYGESDDDEDEGDDESDS